MAEAHSAVAFSFSITHEGWDVNFDREVLHLVWQSGVRSWKKRFARFKNNIKSGIYPAPLQSLWAIVAILAAVHFAKYGIVHKSINAILVLMPGSTLPWELISCTLLGVIVWLAIIYSIRYILKVLLMYKGWMYEQRGKGRVISNRTKIWFFLIKIFSGGSKPLLYSYQGSLPRLPIPSLKETMARYLKSVRPLLNDERYLRMRKLAEEFQNGIGAKLQRYLVLKSWWATNYVSDWWEEYVYLRGRSPLIVNSNFYGIDAVLINPECTQAARAATIISICLQFRRLIERQELEPILIQGLVPLCSWQYERVFNTTRVPGVETDRLVHYADSKHIVVYHKGRYFKVFIYCNGRILRPYEIEIQLEQILSDESPPAKGEEMLAALTAGERTAWAVARQEFFFKGVNRQSLDAIEKAAFVVTLDDFPYEFDEEDPSKLDHYGQILLHGKGYDRWFDKSFTLCIGSNGRIGFNAEHSWADAAIMSHVWEYVILEEETSVNGYTKDGRTDGALEFTPPAPVRLQWNLLPPCIAAIEKSYEVTLNLLNDVDLRIYMHTSYGKGFMKDCRISPDAYIQMALQLAYYRDAARFSLTYEASMTRLFREGRTETVRPCTAESVAWVHAMAGNTASVEERVRLLQTACRIHQVAYQDAMCGKGIDRHLFCLYVVSKYLEVDSPFLKEVLSEPWRLSTSQSPHGQTPKLDLKKFPKCISAGGGFGPVADDGYGVSYIIAGEDLIFFHITCKRSSPETDSSRFAVHIERALSDIKKLFLEWKQLQQCQKK